MPYLRICSTHRSFSQVCFLPLYLLQLFTSRLIPFQISSNTFQLKILKIIILTIYNLLAKQGLKKENKTNY